MTQIAAVDLKVGDQFSRVGSSRIYKVMEIVTAHRSEYAQVIRVRSTSGTEATVAFPADSQVTRKD
jgi:hypothetical protein